MAYIMRDNRFLFSGADRNGDAALRFMFDRMSKGIYCASIGRVDKVNDDQTVDVSVIYNEDNKYNEPISLKQVPLLVLQGGGKYIKFPVVKDDTCLLLFCDRDISDWHSKGVDGEILPTTRMHDFNDAIAICGVNCATERKGDLPDSKSKVVQFCGSGNYFVKWRELNEALEKFVAELETSLTQTPIIGNGSLQKWENFPEKIDIENAKTLNIETGSENGGGLSEEKLKQLTKIDKLGTEHINKIYELLEAAEAEYKLPNGNTVNIADLLRKLWYKYETKLRVHEIHDPKTEPYVDKKSGEYGVFMDINRDIAEIVHIKEYQQIFHEFFHNIDLIIDGGSGFAFSYTYDNNAFARIIIDEAMPMENGNDKVKPIIYSIYDIQVNSDIQYRSYLFDILGGVIYSERIAGLEVNGVEQVEFGHDDDYWKKDPKNKYGGAPYERRIATETFANFASSAITNRGAFEYMKFYLPKSCEKFVEILEKMLAK